MMKVLRWAGILVWLAVPIWVVASIIAPEQLKKLEPPPPTPQQQQEAAESRRAKQIAAEKRAARFRAEDEEKRQLCRIAAACKKYDDARTECAMAGNVTSCVRIKMGDAVRYFDLCSNYDRSLPPAFPAHFTAAPNVFWCWLETSSWLH
jgi:hypothetical protein